MTAARPSADRTAGPGPARRARPSHRPRRRWPPSPPRGRWSASRIAPPRAADQRAAAAGQRVDEREVAVAVAEGEEQEVRDVDEGRQEGPAPRHLAHVTEHEQGDEADEAADQELHAEEGQPVGPHLHGEVPPGVQHGRRQGQHRRLEHPPARGSGAQDVDDEGLGRGRLVADGDGPLERLHGGCSRRAGSSRWSSRTGWPSSTASPTLARQTTPADGETGCSLRARPAPSRHAASPTGSASSAVTTPGSLRPDEADVRADRQRRVGISTLRRDEGAPRRQGVAGRQHHAGVGAVEADEGQHLPGQRDGQLDDVGRTAAGQHLDRLGHLEPRCRRPARAACPCGTAPPWSGRPRPCPSRNMVSASWRADPTSFMNAPEPTLTSRTNAEVPSAIFFDMIELAISGMDSTVPVTSRRAYRRRSAGARPAPAAQMTAPMRCELVDDLLGRQEGPPAGDGLHLVERPTGVAQAPAGELRHGGATGGDERAQREADLVAHPARRVLVDGRAGSPRAGRAGRRWRSSPRSKCRAPAGPCSGRRWPSAGPRPAPRRPRRSCRRRGTSGSPRR